MYALMMDVATLLRPRTKLLTHPTNLKCGMCYKQTRMYREASESVSAPFEEEAPDVAGAAPAVYLLRHVDHRVGIGVHEDVRPFSFKHGEAGHHLGFEFLHATVRDVNIRQTKCTIDCICVQ